MPKFRLWRSDPLHDAVVLLDAATGQPEPLDPGDTVTCRVGTRSKHVATAVTTIADQSVSPGLVQIAVQDTTSWPTGQVYYQLCVTRQGVQQHLELEGVMVEEPLP
jgi:hypothetical protein